MPESQRERPPWEVLDRRTLYAGRRVGLAEWTVRLPDGTVIPDYHVVDYPGEAVAVGDDGRVLLIDHYRVITDTRGWEVPAGGIEPDEPVAEAAARELLEETGYAAAAWQPLGRFHPSNGSSNRVFHVTVARGLARRSDLLDVNETLGLGWFTPAEVRRLILANEIPDGFTVTALSWALVAGLVA
jgi:ADP-ribose pyrophosphatase